MLRVWCRPREASSSSPLSYSRPPGSRRCLASPCGAASGTVKWLNGQMHTSILHPLPPTPQHPCCICSRPLCLMNACHNVCRTWCGICLIDPIPRSLLYVHSPTLPPSPSPSLTLPTPTLTLPPSPSLALTRGPQGRRSSRIFRQRALELDSRQHNYPSGPHGQCNTR